MAELKLRHVAAERLPATCSPRLGCPLLRLQTQT